MDPFNTTKVISPATYLIAGIALLLAGAIIGVFADPYLPSSLSNSKKEYQAGFAAARTLAEESSAGDFFKTEADVRSVSGTVTAIQGDRVTVRTETETNPFEGPAMNERTVVITDATKIIKLVMNNQTVTKTQQAALRVTTVSASSADILVGDSVTVIAGENIKTLAEFTAQEIQILPRTTAR